MIRRPEYQGKSMEVRVGAKCERWNPTAEQVKVLTNLFRSGLRTPTTHQIQMISTHLSAFGKIESKNVFYWFQNHKARERHHKKRRRVLPDDDDGDGTGAAGDHHKSRTRCFPAGCGIKGNQELYVQRKEIREATETLELFPLKSSIFEEEKVITARGELCGRALYLDAGGRDHPPLDLRLSFNYVE